MSTSTRAPAHAAAKPAALPARAPVPLTPASPLFAVRHALGNRTFGAFLQTQLTIGGVNDPYEADADRVADEVMGMQEPSDGAPAIRTLGEDAEPIWMRAVPGAASGAVTSATAAGISSLRGKGDPLAPSLRSWLEPRFGRDFSDVRVHTGSIADSTAGAIGARAYTYGSDIAFRYGAYAPDSSDGRHLLAHELTHVAQQRHAPPRIQRKGDKTPPLLIVEGADFDEAAANFAAMLAKNPRITKARIVLVNGPNVRVYDEAGKLLEKKFFHLQAPAFLPIGVFGRTGKTSQLNAIGLGPQGDWLDAGVVKVDKVIDFGKDIEPIPQSAKPDF